MLTLTQAASRVAARLNKNVNDTTVASRIKNHINDACQEKWHGYAWSFRYREYPITLSAQVTTGTMTATNVSQSITASATPFDSSIHVGAWIRFPTDAVQAWYRILKVNSTSTATIEPAYQGTSASGKSYQLCKTDYLLPTELSDIGRIKVTYDGASRQVQHVSGLDSYYTPPLTIGSPYAFGLFTQDQTYTTYTTGTLTGSINTNTLTGSATSWLTNVQPGDELVISGDTNTYKVYNVDSNTSMTLYNNLGTAAVGASYTISRQFGKVLRTQPCPDQAYVVFIRGLRAYNPLVNNADTNELLIRYPAAVIEAAIWREASASPDPREDSLYMKSEKLWSAAQGEDEALFAQQNLSPIFDFRQVR